jgi:hypothetical protein
MTAHPARDGWLWIRQGLQLFRRNPNELVALNLSYFSAILILGSLPLIGQIIWLLLVPCCCLAMMQACRQVSRSEGVWTKDLLKGLTMPQLPSQLRLGMVWLLATILVSLMVAGLFVLLDDDATWQVLSGQVSPAKAKIDQDNFYIASICAAIVYLPFVAALWFAPALVAWHDMPASKAIFYSFFAVWRSGRAFIIYGLGLIALFFAGIFFSVLISIPLVHLFGNEQLITTAVALLLLLIMISVFYCTLYCTYENVFGTEEVITAP